MEDCSGSSTPFPPGQEAGNPEPVEDVDSDVEKNEDTLSIILAEVRKISQVQAASSSAPSAPAVSALPPVSELPQCDSSNPWVPCIHMVFTTDGFLIIGQFGAKHPDDLVFYPIGTRILTPMSVWRRMWWGRTKIRISDGVG